MKDQHLFNGDVLALLRDMPDAFDFGHHEARLKSIKPQSEQERIFTLMLQDVCSYCDFIQLYAKRSQFGSSSPSASLAFVNILFPDEFELLGDILNGEIQIKELSDALYKRRNAFLGEATISTEITAFQILNNLENCHEYQSDDSDQLSGAGR